MPRRAWHFAAEGREGRHADVDPERGRNSERLHGLAALDLQSGHPAASFLADAHVAQLAICGLAKAQSQPAQLRHLDAAVGRIQAELLRIGEPQPRVVAVALELRRAGTAAAAGCARLDGGEQALVRLMQSAQHLLLRVHRAFGQPRGAWRVAPGREPLAHLRVAGVLLATRMARLLLPERFVPQPAQLARVAGQLSLLRWLAAQGEAVGAKGAHVFSIRTGTPNASARRYPSPP